MLRSIRFFHLIAALLLTTLLFACGGGSGPAAPDPATGSNWDEMEWDKGSWGT